MTPSAQSGAGRRRWLLAATGAAVVLVCAAGLWRSWPAAAPSVAAPQAVAVAAAPLALPEHPRVLVFGDSWTYGSAATVPTLGYAYVLAERLGWDAVIDGVRGSGYLKPGIDGGSYGDRIAALDPALRPDLVIVEGSINDRKLPAKGYRDAVDSAWDALGAVYPDAEIVVLGPAPQVLPVEKATARIDRDLADLASARGWRYVSPIEDDWITESNYASIIDTGAGNDHPSTAGHAYLADRLEAALAAFAVGTEVTADGG